MEMEMKTEVTSTCTCLMYLLESLRLQMKKTVILKVLYFAWFQINLYIFYSMTFDFLT